MVSLTMSRIVLTRWSTRCDFTASLTLMELLVVIVLQYTTVTATASGALLGGGGKSEGLKPKAPRWVLSAITHPFLVLRHQCQLHILYPFPSAPFGSVAALYRAWASQGVTGLWRGSVTLLLNDICFELVQDGLMAVYEHLRHKKERPSQHVALGLRLLSYGLVTPLMTGVVVAVVQFTAQKVYRAGLSSILELAWERPWFAWKGALFSTLSLALPTALVAGIRCVVSSAVQQTTYSVLRKLRKDRGADKAGSAELLGVVDVDRLCASVVGAFAADVVTYPVETALLRAHIQGHPVLLDDVEVGLSPVLLTTDYKSWRDMYWTVHTMEGRWGFYKGFSAMLLQYLVQGLVLAGLYRARGTALTSTTT